MSPRPEPVLIVGGGPTGLVLAFELARRGVRCTLIEQKPEPQFLPKMERCNARTMEIFRRAGIADKVRAAGLPSGVPMDVFIVLAMDRRPLLHLPYPSVDEAKARIEAAPNDGSLPCEPYQLISQYTLEPLLKAELERKSCVDLRFGCEFLEFAERPDGVEAVVRSTDGSTERLSGAYLVGCDGGSSRVRRQLGIRLSGEGDLLRLRQGLFRCDQLFDMLPIGDGPGRGRHYHVADDRATFLIMQDSTRHWTLHSVVDSDEEMRSQFEKTLTRPVNYDMLYCGEWRQNLLLADSYQRGRVFLAGDAVHLVIPTGGLGMNTGVGDAVDLAWKLWATVSGWGGPGLLRSYEVERRQVGERNVEASRYASRGRRKWRSLWKPDIGDDTPSGTKARDRLAAVADIEQRKTNEMIGAELGYRYVGSPLICEEEGGPDHLFRSYEPTSWPGVRLPHVRTSEGGALQDRIGDGFVLLRLGGAATDAAPLGRAFAQIGAPFAVLDVGEPAAREVYGCDLVLVRPDLHVVWRGNDMHECPTHLAQVAIGHSVPASRKPSGRSSP